MAQLRTFVAFEISEELRDAGRDVIRQLSEVADGVRWVKPQNMHVTLKFLGEVEDRELNDVCRAVSGAAAGLSSFSLDCRSVGAFPNTKRPATLWMGLDDPHDQLHHLQGRIEESAAAIGFAQEHRPYRGHITLGRIRTRRENGPLTTMLNEMANREFADFSVNELIVFSSEMERSGPVYTAISRIPLK